MQQRDRRRDGHQRDRWLRQALATDRALHTVSPIALRRLRPGVVVWAHIPFQEVDGWKLRPAVVVRAEARTVLLRPVTGAASRFGRHDHVELEDLDTAGLAHPCAVRLGRDVEVDRTDVVTLAGRLSLIDELRIEVTEALSPFFALPSLGVVAPPLSRPA
jgi:hypothetical protein